MQRAMKVFFELSSYDKRVVFETFELASNVFNEHVDWAFENRTVSKTKAHKQLYVQLRTKYPTFPSALLQLMRDLSLEAVKHNKFRFRPKKKLKSAVKYDARTLSLKGSVLTFSSCDKRIRVLLTFSKHHINATSNWQRCGGSIIGFDQRKQKFFVVLLYKKDDPEKKLSGEVIGIDRGIKNLVTLSDGTFLGKEIKKVKRKFSYLRKKLMTKGTRSAKRVLKRVSGREMRFSRDVNHVITKQLANDLSVAIYALEDLKGIRNKKRGRKMNRWLGSWPFFQFEAFLKYKCIATGINVVKVNAHYTSQMCSKCGYIDKKNRNGHKFRCLKCGHKDHADINAAKNIKQRYMTMIFISSQGGSQSPERMGVKAPHSRFSSS